MMRSKTVLFQAIYELMKGPVSIKDTEEMSEYMVLYDDDPSRSIHDFAVYLLEQSLGSTLTDDAYYRLFLCIERGIYDDYPVSNARKLIKIFKGLQFLRGSDAMYWIALYMKKRFEIVEEGEDENGVFDTLYEIMDTFLMSPPKLEGDTPRETHTLAVNRELAMNMLRLFWRMDHIDDDWGFSNVLCASKPVFEAFMDRDPEAKFVGIPTLTEEQETHIQKTGDEDFLTHSYFKGIVDEIERFYLNKGYGREGVNPYTLMKIDSWVDRFYNMTYFLS